MQQQLATWLPAFAGFVFLFNFVCLLVTIWYARRTNRAIRSIKANMKQIYADRLKLL